MTTIGVSEFKARCIALLKSVQRTRRPLLVTLRGEPIARIGPAPGGKAAPRLGALRGQLEIRGDIVGADFGNL
ncbi:MAG: type II toxin-antitoxin system Phd/YefM family antitoxin [Planctomycetes bacterium]|nr:type II toxin-antitoxin system Phd/YefM family antitoxin [Planctomycetota bacterium]